MTYKIDSLSHKDLVNLIATATYGNSEAIEIYVPEDCREHYVGECWEDKVANVLLHGGRIEVLDGYSEEHPEDYNTYGEQGKNWISTRWQEFTTWDMEEQGQWGHVVYIIDLNNILYGINQNEHAKKLAHDLFVDEDDDLYTAYNLLQCIIFGGEEIYG